MYRSQFDEGKNQQSDRCNARSAVALHFHNLKTLHTFFPGQVDKQ